MTWRDRDGDLYDEPPAWTHPRGPAPTALHPYRADDAGLSCDLCGLPSRHPRHTTAEETP